MLLAMPAVSMSWYSLPLLSLLTLTLTLSFFPFFPYRSMLLFFAFILSFVWLTGSGNDPPLRAPLNATAVLGSRVAVTGVLVLGLVFLAMIVKTLMRYGSEWGKMMTADVEMGMGAVSVQGVEPEERGRKRRERDRGRDGERRICRRGGADRHVEEHLDLDR